MSSLTKLICICMLFLLSSADVIAAPLKLQCKGRMPMYDALGNRFNVSETEGVESVVLVDFDNMIIAMSLFHAENIKIPLGSKNIDHMFYGTAPFNAVFAGTVFNTVYTSIDRVTGKISSWYGFGPGHEMREGPKLAYDGYCSLFKTKF